MSAAAGRGAGRAWLLRCAYLTAALLAVAGIVISLTGSPTADLETRTREVSATLRCPTCAGETVADSTAPLATSMRAVVAEQLAADRTPAQVRQWFVERYGDEVLLDPPARGPGLLLWVLPVAGVGLAAVVLLRGVPGRRRASVAAVTVSALLVSGAVLAAGTVRAPHAAADAPAPGTATATAPGATPAPSTPTTAPSSARTVDLLRQAARAAPGDSDLQLAAGRALDAGGDPESAAEHYAAAVRLDPFDVTSGFLLGSALTRSGRPDEAVPVLQDVLRSDPEHPETLLLLGTVLHRSGEPEGEQLLTTFLEVAGDHGAAQEVRALLDEQAGRSGAGSGNGEKGRP